MLEIILLLLNLLQNVKGCPSSYRRSYEEGLQLRLSRMFCDTDNSLGVCILMCFKGFDFQLFLKNRFLQDFSFGHLKT